MQTISSISRAELFEALWQKPMTQLSAQWGISRKEIVQLCEQYSIPRPPNGYWAQLNWGTAPERPTLPTLDVDDLIELDAFRKQFENRYRSLIRQLLQKKGHPFSPRTAARYRFPFLISLQIPTGL